MPKTKYRILCFVCDQTYAQGLPHKHANPYPGGPERCAHRDYSDLPKYGMVCIYCGAILIPKAEERA